jgi:predicted transposase/invertase (TIGR01784 family)
MIKITPLSDEFIYDVLELRGDDQIHHVDFLSPIQDPEISSKKQSIVDVLCRDKNGVQIIVEMQVAPTKGFEKRAQYYASKAYFGQLNKGKKEDGKYPSLKEVIFIAIADCVVFRDKVAYKSDHVILDKKTHEHDLKDFSFTFIELPKFKKDKIENLDNILEKWCYFFKYADETSEEDLNKLIGSDLVIKEAYDELNQFNWSESELVAYDGEIKRIRDNIATLDYQYDKGKAEGLEKGKAEGLEKGKAEGLEKGKAEGREEGKNERNIEVAINMLNQNMDTSIISLATGLSEEKINELKSHLKD